jgi:hypothetical protein
VDDLAIAAIGEGAGLRSNANIKAAWLETRAAHRAALAALLTLHAVLLAYGAFAHSPAIDEWGHLPCGLLYWTEGRTDVYRVNPPLVRMVAALPVLIAGPKVDWTVPKAEGVYRPELLAAMHFCLTYGADAFPYFAWARLACIPFSLLGGWICYRWGQELYGRSAGLAAMTLWCLSPDILAHAQMITPDAPAASIGVAANYAFWRWLQRPAWSATILAGGALGLALLTKCTWLVLLPLWPAMWLAAGLGRLHAVRLSTSAIRMAAILLLALVVVNAAYGFLGCCTRLERYRFVSRAWGGSEDSPPTTRDTDPHCIGNKYAGSLVGWLPIPLPRDYVLGLDRQKLDFESKMPSYLRGTWKRAGWWYYYLYAMAVKTPLGTLGLLAMAVASLAFPRGRSVWRAELALLAPAVSVLVLVSSQTGFSHHLRYALPSFPFLYVFAAKSFSPAVMVRRECRAMACILLGWSLSSSVAIYPHSLSYFNELVGGPRRGHYHLLDSNIDWGQDLIYLRQWLDRHRDLRLRGIALPLSLSPQLAGVDVPPPPTQPEPGLYAISVTRIHEPSSRYLYFLRLRPFALVGYSIYIYRISLAEANRVRVELGLPPFEDFQTLGS